MGIRVSYPREFKLKAVEMKLKGIPTKVNMEELNVRETANAEFPI